MQADIHTLFESDFYRVLDFRCRCTDCNTSKPEYSNAFAVSFVRKGNFLFNVFRHSLDSYNGCVLITKPGYEHTVTHTHTIPDECTIFDFKKDFYKKLADYYGNSKFFSSNDLHSTLVHSNPEIEFLHFYILQLIQSRAGSKLQVDNLVLDLAHMVLNSVVEYKPREKIDGRLKKNHLVTIERAKEFIAANFTTDISLSKIAEHSFVSLFHFSRIFKTFTSVSPHQFLLGIRLQHASMLLRNTSVPVADIAFTSGFNSVEYFTAAFKQKYNIPPGQFRVASSSCAIPN